MHSVIHLDDVTNANLTPYHTPHPHRKCRAGAHIHNWLHILTMNPAIHLDDVTNAELGRASITGFTHTRQFSSPQVRCAFSTEIYAGCYWDHAFAPLEALTCVCPMASLSRDHFLTVSHCKLRPNTEGSRTVDEALRWVHAWFVLASAAFTSRLDRGLDNNCSYRNILWEQG
jgi:hypothetical protein